MPTSLPRSGSRPRRSSTRFTASSAPARWAPSTTSSPRSACAPTSSRPWSGGWPRCVRLLGKQVKFQRAAEGQFDLRGLQASFYQIQGVDSNMTHSIDDKDDREEKDEKHSGIDRRQFGKILVA